MTRAGPLARAFRTTTAVLLGTAALLLGPAAVDGQESGTATLEGQVVDSVTGAPLADVLVQFDTGPRTLSDAGGRFHLEGLPPGAHVLALLTADCRVTWSEVDLVAGEAARLRVPVAGPRVGPGEERREQHRRGAGTLVTSAEIEAMGVRTLKDVIRRLEPNILARGRATLQPIEGFTVVVDGVRVANADRTLDMLQPSDVETMELLPGPAAGWAYGTAGSSGVVRIDTRSGGRPRGGEIPTECAVPDFPGSGPAF